MAGAMSLDAVKRKIQALHAQADGAEERALSLQRELELERQQRENVSDEYAIRVLSSFPFSELLYTVFFFISTFSSIQMVPQRYFGALEVLVL